MPRKRTISDQALLDAALGIVRDSGPDALTFAALSAGSGLAGSTIVQRFGTKAALLQAALLRAWDRLDEETTAAIADAGHGAHAVVELLVRLSGQYDAERFADQLLLLREDLRDPVLRGRGTAWLTQLYDAIERRLERRPGDASGLGELMVAHWQGTLTVWSFNRSAALPTAVRTALEDLVERLQL